MPPYQTSTATMASFKIDEGYSEETRSLSDGDLAMRVDSNLGLSNADKIHTIPLPIWITELGEADRKGKTLNTSCLSVTHY